MPESKFVNYDKVEFQVAAINVGKSKDNIVILTAFFYFTVFLTSKIFNCIDIKKISGVNSSDGNRIGEIESIKSYFFKRLQLSAN